jgi:ANTAR domain/GAF domain
MSAQTSAVPAPSAREAALASLANSAAGNIPGVDFVSITVHRADDSLYTAASSHREAELADAWQYELHEGPCYAAVNDQRFVLANDLVAAATEFPRYAPRAVELGMAAQAAIQLMDDGKQQAGLNMYARTAGSFDQSTMHMAELFATQAGAILGYAEQVDQLSVALHARTDIGTAVGILMERYSIDRQRAFAFLTRNSQHRNIKVRILANQIIDGTFQDTPSEEGQGHQHL